MLMSGLCYMKVWMPVDYDMSILSMESLRVGLIGVSILSMAGYDFWISLTSGSYG